MLAYWSKSIYLRKKMVCTALRSCELIPFFLQRKILIFREATTMLMCCSVGETKWCWLTFVLKWGYYLQCFLITESLQTIITWCWNWQLHQWFCAMHCTWPAYWGRRVEAGRNGFGTCWNSPHYIHCVPSNSFWKKI